MVPARVTFNRVSPGNTILRVSPTAPHQHVKYSPPVHPVGVSPAIHRLRAQIARIAPHYRTALVTGAPGSDLRGIALALHQSSPGAGGEFVVCEAGGVAEALTMGPCEEAAGGTLFLDGLDAVPVALQSTMLRLWTQRGRMRIVAGARRDLRTMVITGHFRQELLDCVAGVEIVIPSLRERPEDIPVLLADTLSRIAKSSLPESGPSLYLSEAAHARLIQHGWPGDEAEIDHVLTQAAARSTDGCIEPHHLPDFTVPASSEPSVERLQDVVQMHVLRVLTRCAGNKLRAAERLGISRSTLYRMLESGITV